MIIYLTDQNNNPLTLLNNNILITLLFKKISLYIYNMHYLRNLLKRGAKNIMKSTLKSGLSSSRLGLLFLK